MINDTSTFSCFAVRVQSPYVFNSEEIGFGVGWRGAAALKAGVLHVVRHEVERFLRLPPAPEIVIGVGV